MSLDVETHAHSHAHTTGHKWVDMTVAFSALFVSVVSLGVAILHGRTMEKMAEANARLVAANSWPFLSYSSGINTTDGVAKIHMAVFNTGVGPAKIESAELIWKDTAYRSDEDFLKACCGFDPASHKRPDSSLLPNQVLRAGEHINFLEFSQPVSPQVFEALRQAMFGHDLQNLVPEIIGKACQAGRGERAEQRCLFILRREGQKARQREDQRVGELGPVRRSNLR